MITDKTKLGTRSRVRVTLNEDYEVEYLMNRYNLARPRVLKLMAKHGGNRKKIESELGRHYAM